ncbi:MAG: ABC transporter permease, partial [Candidatus Bathyarchaeia archaeon]
WEALVQAFNLIATGDPEVASITLRSLQVSGLATLLACLWSLPFAMILGLRSFKGKGFVKGVFNALIGVPTVALGLVLYMLFSRSGPLGVFGLLYTPVAISIGQAVLVTPIIVTFGTSALESVNPELRDLARTLGASELQTSLAVLREASFNVLLAVVAAFNRAFAELGIAMMVGGNIRYVTRVLTTSIALETARGEVAFSLALAIVLVAIVYGVSLALNLLRRAA